MQRGLVVAAPIAAFAVALAASLVSPPRFHTASAHLLSANRTVFTSSTADGAHTGANAVDGYASTRWASAKGSEPQWITIDLGAVASISRVRLDWDAAYASAYTIQISVDGSIWSPAAVATGGDGGIDDHPGLSARGRYVRVDGTSSGRSDGYSLREVEVFGIRGPASGRSRTSGGALTWAGVRSSGYGIRGSARIPFPSPQQWESATKTMSGYFPDSTPSAIWLVGDVDFSNHGMVLEFPRPDDGVTYGPLYQFQSGDKHEPYLDYFDTHGVGVFLQIEPGDADVPTLIDLVLNRYRNHPSVMGLAIDAEWINKTSLSDVESAVTDAQARAWEQRVKEHKSSYRMILKHFNEAYLPPTYRGDVIFVCDDERNGTYEAFLAEHKKFAERFYPSEVMFQIGYASDRVWWSQRHTPIPETVGRDLSAQTRQDHGVLWVDFSIADPLINLIPQEGSFAREW